MRKSGPASPAAVQLECSAKPERSTRKTEAHVQPGMNKPSDLSFKPGAGHPPPFLAGRDAEKAAIRKALDRLGAGLSPSQNIALIGPRGNGKTVLIRWAEEQIGRCSGDIKCEVLHPESFESHRDLVGSLADQDALSALAGEGFTANISSLGSEVGSLRQEAAKKLLRPVLEKRCSKNGLAILIDEAHTLHRRPDLIRAFFNDVQTLVGKGRPLLLILAGTPDITTRLNVIEATFWDRLNKIGIGLLSAEAAHEALRIPLEGMGFRIEAGVLDKAADEAQCYPYFVQVVGDALHHAAEAEPGSGIGGAVLERALATLEDRKNNYYSGRYQELRRAGILPAAEAVAQLFASKKESIFNSDFEVAVERSLDRKMKKLAKSKGWIEPAAWFESELRDLGFVWSRIGHEHLCEPGIPSLMDYVVEMARERERSRAKASK